MAVEKVGSLLLWTANDPWTASALNRSAKHCNYCRLSSRIQAPLPLPSCPLSSGPSPLVAECAPVNSVFIHLDAISRQGTAVSGVLASMIRYKSAHVCRARLDLVWWSAQPSIRFILCRVCLVVSLVTHFQFWAGFGRLPSARVYWIEV